MLESSTEPLSWKGYSARRFISLEAGVAELSKRSDLYNKLPMLQKSTQSLSRTDASILQAMQKLLLDRTGHSVGMMLYFGMIDAAKAHWLREQVGTCFEALCYFARTFLTETTAGLTISTMIESLEPSRAVRLRSVLETSKYNYPRHQSASQAWITLAKQYPLFIEAGVDLMCSADEFMFSEAQIRYNAPRPYSMNAAREAYLEIFYDFFERHQIQEDTFEEDKLRLLQTAFDRFSAAEKAKMRKVIIDAWTFENDGSNMKEMAQSLGADYVLFDDIFREGNPFNTKYSKYDKLFILNHPALHLLCPDAELFRMINDEHLEEYDDLAWPELFEKHMQGRVFFANPPCTDILNDKALYEYVPDFARLFLSKEIELPVVRSSELWDYNDQSKVNEDNLAWTIDNQAEAVIAHRYLEGGMGIRIGKFCDKAEWTSFINNFVKPRPYLFVVRPYFAMQPDCSLRLMTCALTDPAELGWHPTICVGTDMFGRVSIDTHVSSESSRCYLAFAEKAQ